MKKTYMFVTMLSAGGLLLAGCERATDSFISNAPGMGGDFLKAEQKEQDAASPEESALAAYSSLLAGDRTLLDEGQQEMWWIPDFQDESMEYEYTYLDLDGDGMGILVCRGFSESGICAPG